MLTVACSALWSGFWVLLCWRRLSGLAALELTPPCVADSRPDVRVAALNEAVLELEPKLIGARTLSRACGRVTLAGAACLSLFQVAVDLLSGGLARSSIWAIASFVLGLFGAAGCFAISNAEQRHVARLRSQWRALIRRWAGDVAT